MGSWNNKCTFHLIKMCLFVDGKDCEEFIVPMDKSVLELGQSDISSGTCEGQENSFSPTSQLVLVCSWRCMKEVSLLLGDLVERLSLQTIELSGLLTVKQVRYAKLLPYFPC